MKTVKVKLKRKELESMQDFLCNNLYHKVMYSEKKCKMLDKISKKIEKKLCD